MSYPYVALHNHEPEFMRAWFEHAADPAYQIQNGYHSEEEKEIMYRAVRDAVLEANEESGYLNELTVEEFEQAYDFMEDYNYHAENSALCFIADQMGIEHPYIEEAKSTYDAFLYEN